MRIWALGPLLVAVLQVRKLYDLEMVHGLWATIDRAVGKRVIICT